MKLNYFSEQTLPKLNVGGKSGTPKVSFNKSGTISFNGKACELLSLKTGDKVTLAQDEDEPGNWYFFKDENGFAVRDGYDKKGCLFNHSVLVKTFNECFGLPAETKGYIIAGKPTKINGSKTEYWGILINGEPIGEER